MFEIVFNRLSYMVAGGFLIAAALLSTSHCLIAIGCMIISFLCVCFAICDDLSFIHWLRNKDHLHFITEK